MRAVFWLGAFLGAASPAFAQLQVTVTQPPVPIGMSIGQSPRWIDFQGSGNPGVYLNGTTVWARGSTASNDYADMEIIRTTSFNGGSSSDINAGLRLIGDFGANDHTQEWLFTAAGTTHGGTGLLVAAYHQANIALGATQAHAWATISDARDETTAASSVSGSTIVAHELDLRANRADDASNPLTFGGFGTRKGIQIVVGRLNTGEVTPAEFSSGIWFSQSVAADTPDLYSYTDQGIGFAVGTQIRSALDTRGAITPTGSSNPVSAVMMSAGHVIDFNGGASLGSVPGRTLVYVTGDTALEYLNGATALVKFYDNGAASLGPSNTVSGTDALVTGLQSSDRGRYGAQTRASGQFGAAGDAQIAWHVLRGSGATGSAFRLTADAAAAGAANCVNIPNNAAYSVIVDVMAFDVTTVTKNETWQQWGGLLTRGANAASTAVTMASTPTPISNGTVTGSAIAVTADTTNGCLNVSFTPPTSNTDTWHVVARVNTVEAQ